MSSLEILSQGQFLPLITDSLVLQCLFPQFLTVPVVSSWTSRHKDTFPTSSPPRHLTLCCSLWQDQTVCSTGPEHFPSVLRTFFFLSSPSSALFPPHPFPPLSSGSSHMSLLKLWCLLSSITFSYTCWLHGLRSPLAGPASILMRPALSWTIPLLFPNKYMGTRCLIPALTGFQSRSTLTMRWITIQFGDTLNPASMLVPYLFPLQCASPLCTVALIYASFHHALLYCALRMMHFLQSEGLWQPCIEQVL